MSKRNAIRIGNPHDEESIAYTVSRYGAMKQETLDKLVEWLKTQSDYHFEVMTEYISHPEIGTKFPITVLKTRFRNSAIEKYIDNEHDAQNCLTNIQNQEFPANKQGS